jgi:hypothetical protein
MVNSPIVTIAWDVSTSSIGGGRSPVSHYDLYCRQLGTGQWRFLKQQSGSEPHATISFAHMGEGSYEIGIQEVHKDGNRSELHTSTDFSAWPPGGWYLVWEQR